MNPVGLSKEHVSSTAKLCLLKTSIDLQVLFAAVKHLLEELSLDTLFTDVKGGKVSNFLSGYTETNIFIREQQSILFLKTLITNKASRFFRLE
jgi:hypothetical protein